MRATGMPDWMVAIAALHAASTDGNGHTPPEIASGIPESLSVSSVITPERAFRADHQPGEIVAGRRLLGAARGRHQLAVRQHDFQREHIVLHGAVAHGIGAGAARGRHAAERSVGAGIEREEQALVAQMLVELLARDAGLDHAVEVLRIHRQHAVHVAKIDRHAAMGRIDMALERRAGAEGNDRHAVRGADAHDVLHVIGRLREHHCVGRLARDPGRRIGVLLAHGLRGDEPVAELRGQRGDDGLDRVGIAALCSDQAVLPAVPSPTHTTPHVNRTASARHGAHSARWRSGLASERAPTQRDLVYHRPRPRPASGARLPLGGRSTARA